MNKAFRAMVADLEKEAIRLRDVYIDGRWPATTATKIADLKVGDRVKVIDPHSTAPYRGATGTVIKVNFRSPSTNRPGAKVDFDGLGERSYYNDTFLELLSKAATKKPQATGSGQNSPRDFRVGDTIKKVKNNVGPGHDFFVLGSVAKITRMSPNQRPQVEGYCKSHGRDLSQNIDVNDWELVTGQRDMPVLDKAVSGLKDQNNDGRSSCFDCGSPTKHVAMLSSWIDVCTKCGK